MTTARTIDEQIKLIGRGSVEILSESELREKLAAGRPLRVKAGFDPTAADLHLGHTVLLHKLRQFQLLGHQVVFLIGDFTARIGDPTGRSVTRPVLSAAEIREHARSYQEQVFRILDRERTEVRWNSEWMDAMSAADIIRLASEHTVARMLERDDFDKRYRGGQAIGIHEFLYPLVQGFDSVALEADIEIGGTDQKFNLLVGRALQKSRGTQPQVVLTMPLLEGTDGSMKMSKSQGNAIGIADSPEQMFGSVMSISDELMLRYYELLSDADEQSLAAIRGGGMHPMEAKKALARELVARFHGESAADAADADFQLRFQRRQLPDNLPEVPMGATAGIVAALVGWGLVSSNGEARRMIAQGAVRVDGAKVESQDFALPVGEDFVVQVGKRRMVRVRAGR